MAKLTDSERRVREVSKYLGRLLTEYCNYSPGKNVTPDEWSRILGPLVEDLTNDEYEVRRAEHG